MNLHNLNLQSKYYMTQAVPPVSFLTRYRNRIRAFYSFNKSMPLNRGNPVTVRIAPTNVCNYRCLFCEIHTDHRLYPQRVHNVMTLDTIKSYEPFLATATHLNFYGGTAEPLADKYFGDIVAYLKNKYGMHMAVNTNGSLLSEELSEILVASSFDLLLLSYHAGTPERYKVLTGGDKERIDTNMRYLRQQRKKQRRSKPAVHFHFALHRQNADEYPQIIDMAGELEVATIVLNKYHGGRNLLQDQAVAFDYDHVAGNKVLDAIYAYAARKGVRLSPAKPDYFKKREGTVSWNADNYSRTAICSLPWTALHFNPVLHEKNCHYVGVCNRIELFKLDYERFAMKSQRDFERLWNHPLLQYLRRTVKGPVINPVCKYCRNADRDRIRNTDINRYNAIRDAAIREFFESYHEGAESEHIEGLKILSENPFSDARLFASEGSSNAPSVR